MNLSIANWQQKELTFKRQNVNKNNLTISVYSKDLSSSSEKNARDTVTENMDTRQDAV